MAAPLIAPAIRAMASRTGTANFLTAANMASRPDVRAIRQRVANTLNRELSDIRRGNRVESLDVNTASVRSAFDFDQVVSDVVAGGSAAEAVRSQIIPHVSTAIRGGTRRIVGQEAYDWARSAATWNRQYMRALQDPTAQMARAASSAGFTADEQESAYRGDWTTEDVERTTYPAEREYTTDASAFTNMAAGTTPTSRAYRDDTQLRDNMIRSIRGSGVLPTTIENYMVGLVQSMPPAELAETAPYIQNIGFFYIFDSDGSAVTPMASAAIRVQIENFIRVLGGDPNDIRDELDSFLDSTR